MRYRFCLLALVAGICLGQQLPDPAAFAQAGVEETSRLTQAWLYSGVPRNVAWAAYFIARDSRQDMVSGLIAQLDAYSAQGLILRPADVTDSDAAMQAVADALIRLHAAVPAGAAMKLYPRFQSQAALLLSRAPDNRDALQVLFRDKLQDVWLAAGNLLAPRPPPGFVKELLDDFLSTARVTVLDPGQRVPDGTGGGCAGDWMMDRPDRFKNWPPVDEYGLVVDNRGGGHDFAPGIHPVYYWTWKTTDFLPHGGGDCSPGRDNRFRLGLLAQVAGLSLAAFPLHEFENLTVRYQNAAGYAEELHRFVAALGGNFAKATASWAGRGVITGAEAGSLTLRVDLKISDERGNRAEELPGPPDLTPFRLVRQ